MCLRDKGSNASGKVATIVAGMLTGADSIDDLDVVRHGGMPVLFGGVYAPSTLGEFLRAFTHGHVRQLQSVSREFLVQLARRTPLLPGAGAVTFVDVDSLLRRVYGKKKQGVGFGHAKIGGYQVLLRGYNPLVATISTPDAAPVIAATQLRAGNAGSARGAASLVAEAIATTKAVLTARPTTVPGEIVLRADSAFYSRKVIAACRRAGARFSITNRVDKKVRATIEAIPADAWIEIEYPHPVWDDEQQRFVSRAQIAEIAYTAFEGTRDEVTARLIVRRIPDLNKTTVDGQGQLFPVWRYHASFSDTRSYSSKPRPSPAPLFRTQTSVNDVVDTSETAPDNLRPIRRQRRLARLHRDRAQPHPGRRHPGRTSLRHRTPGHRPPAPDQPCRPRRPPRQRRHDPPAATLALAASMAAPVRSRTRTTCLTIHTRHTAARRPTQLALPKHPSNPAPGRATQPTPKRGQDHSSSDNLRMRLIRGSRLRIVGECRKLK